MEWKKEAKRLIRPFVRLFSFLPPNLVTLLGFLLVLSGCWFVYSGRYRPGGCIILLGGLFDTLDGEIARYRKRETRFGAFLDSTLDRYAEFFIITIAGLSASALIPALFALLGSYLTSYTRARAEGLGVKDIARGLFQRPERFFILVIGLLIGGEAIRWSLIVVAVGANITALQRIYWVWKTLKKGGENG